MTNRFIQKGKFKELDCAITNPQSTELKFVLVFCDASGKYDASISNEILKKWNKPKDEYRLAFVNQTGFKLGAYYFVAVQSDVWVTNCLVLKEDRSLDEVVLDKMLKQLLDKAKFEKATIHVSSKLMDYCSSLKTKLEEVFVNNGVNVYIYNK